MKKIIIIAIFAVFTLATFSQSRVFVSKEEREKSCIKAPAVFETMNFSATQQNSQKNIDSYESYVIGDTYYDNQTNSSVQNRMFLYPDGFIGGTFTFGDDFPSFPERGTGYNNFDDSEWGSWPLDGIESDRTGWPSYAPWGENGEIVAAHYSGASTEGIVFSKRTTKGSGSWTEFDFMGPDGHSLLWPRITTSGPNHNTIHLVAITMPIANGGLLYQGQDGAILYSRSSDGGVTWDIENNIIEGLGSSFYTGFEGDIYEIAYPKANTLAILIGNDWTDLILLKSTDNGNTWTKTVIWEHPYPLFDPNNLIETDTFYCVDGSHSVAIDNAGKIHVAFGINRAICDGSIQYWFPKEDGVGYWNEDMPTFSNNLNALNPYGVPGSELVEDYNLIGWMQDLNGNGMLDLMDEIGTYYVGASSMPQLVIDDQYQIFLIYSSVTEGYSGGMTDQNYRHLWARGSNDNGLSWGDFLDLNNGLIYVFDECVFPSCSPTTDESIHFLYQGDNEPGLATRGDMDPYDVNYIYHYSIEKTDIITPNPGNTLTGIVTELDGGAPIGGATILLEGTSYTVTSSSSGTYSIYDIPAGSYVANCSKVGFIEESATVLITSSNTTIQNFDLIQVVTPADGTIGGTMYDLQSNASMQNRIYKYTDGTIGTAWTLGMDFPVFPDRGTGYNYYNGIEWEAFPTTKLESIRTGWPSYAPLGENGELVVSHNFAAGSLYFLSREEKGEGIWSEQEFLGPVGTNISWNRTITSGTDHNIIHVLALTWPIPNGGTLYQGLDGALLYSRSTDGGASWNQENVVMDGTTSTDYYGFSADNYEWASKGNQVALLVGSPWTDLFLMKSADNGTSWSKTVIWNHPYPLFNTNNPTVTDTFYCADGAHSLCFDESGMVHVAFALTRAYGGEAGLYTFSEVDGIAYWNEDMTTFSSDLNALSPYGDTGSELIQDYNLIGWSQDLNGNGELDILDDWGEYYLGLSSMPQLVIDESNNRFLIYSSVTESYNNGMQNYRRLWARGFNNTSQAWGEFIDLNLDLIYLFSECVFPSCAPTIDDQIHLLFMEDNEPGLAVRGDEDAYTNNDMVYMNVSIADILPELEIGVLIGTVTEALGGDPISDASIYIQGTTFITSTGADGTYEIPGIPSGSYLVSCEKSGYMTETVYLEITGSNTTLQNFQLEDPEPPVGGQIGETYFDLQSNASMQNRIFKYGDGTIGAIWTMSIDFPFFPDRGTGYNYYDGTNWAPIPTETIEPDRTGWPSYAPWGMNGEIVVAHYSGAAIDGLVINSRQNKGTGDWMDINFYGPASNYYLWPRAMTGGSDYSDLHLIAITAPVANGGTTYQGMDGALLYSRSPDGGSSWDHENVLLDGINADFFIGFSGDSYTIQTQGNNVAFLVGYAWTDLVLMKSSDNGDTWSKTIIWDHPYPMFDPSSPIVTDEFYNVDGAHSLAFDPSGKVHVAFGINKSFSDGSSTNWTPEVGGIGYWNEDRPSFSNNLNALSPYGDPGSELVQDYSLIGWSQDLDGNGELDLEDDWGAYFLGLSSMPQLVIDEMNNIFLVYSSVTEYYYGGNSNQNYRHLWARGSNSGGETWGEFVHLTSSPYYVFSECVFPSLSPTTDNSLHLIFQEDMEPGMAVRGDEDPATENHIVYMNILKSDIIDLTPGGILQGTVTDVSGGFPIDNATVSLQGTSYSATTSASGNYIIGNIPTGDYMAICSKLGYFNGTIEVNIVENVITMQDFEMVESTGLAPPENLTIEVIGQNSFLLEWDPPITGSPIGYHLYRNNVNIGFYTILSATETDVFPGSYTYFVTAVYDGGESLPSNTVEAISYEPLLPPINLSANVYENNVFLTWDPPLSGATPAGYYVYRGLLLLNYTTSTSYLDENLESGTYEYYVTSYNDQGESEPTEILEVYIPEPCNPPENVTATIIDNNDLHVTWDPPTLGFALGYNLYQNNVLIDLIFTTEIYFYDLLPGVYEICVASVCLEGESELACADPVTISLAPPLNLITEIFGTDIILSWVSPEEKALLGYNVYHNHNNGDFSLFAYVTQNSCIYADAEVGYHNFYVTAVYDEGESDPSNMVEVVITLISTNDLKALSIHPNPASEFVNIKARVNIESIKIYNHSGEVVGDISVNNNYYKFDISGFSTGLYFFQLTTSEGVISRRVIIE